MKIVPITFKAASEYINQYHRHHNSTAGCKFCIGLDDDNGNLCGVAVCGRPVSRFLDDGKTLEINRLCTNGAKNACSMLYGACIRVAKAMGYQLVITYTLDTEYGASLKASNFVYDGLAGGEIWTGTRKRDNGVPKQHKKRWVYTIRK